MKNPLVSTFLLLTYFSFGQYRFEHIGTDNGLSQNTIYSTSKHDGYIWIATQNGLNRFDGYKMKVYKVEEHKNLQTNFIQATFEDAQKNLIVGTVAGTSVHNTANDSLKTFSDFFGTTSELDHISIKKIVGDPNDNIWILTDEKGVYFFDKKKKKISSYLSNQNNFTDISVSPSTGEVWVATDSGLYKLDKAQNQFLLNTEITRFVLKFDILRSILVDHLGQIWVGTFEHGVFVFNKNPQQTTYKLNKNFQKINGFGKEAVTIFQSQQNLKVWIGYRSTGLTIYDFATHEVAYPQHSDTDLNSLTQNYVISIYEDPQGIVWVGTSGGAMNKYDPRKFPFATLRANNTNFDPSTNMVFSINEENNNLYLGTITGGFLKYNKTSKQLKRFIPENSQINHNQIFSVKKDDKGHFWIATGKGLCRFDIKTEQFQPFVPKENSKKHIYFFGIEYAATTEQVWGGGQRGLYVFDIKKNKWSDLEKDPNLAEVAKLVVRTLYLDKNQNMWICTLGHGLYKYNLLNKSLYNYGPTNGFACKNARTVYETQNTLWVGTDCGLTAIDKKTYKVTKNYTEGALPNNVVYGIAADSNNFLWLSSNMGIAKFDLKTGKTAKLFTKEDGLQANEFNTNTTHINASGEMYFGGVNGVSSIHPNQIAENKILLPTKITNLITQHRAIDLFHKNIVLEPSENFIELHFANLNFSNTPKNEYKYKLSSVDKEWVVSKNRNFCNYTNLAPGSYTFSVIGINSDGYADSQPTTITFSIKYHFYQTLWFKLLVALAIIAIAYYLLFFMKINKILSLKVTAEEKARKLQEQLMELHEAEFKTKIAETELIALRSQINPHFLFNCLNSIKLYSLENKPEKASNFLNLFSKLIRVVLETSDQKITNLEKELEIISLYLEIEKTRLGKKIDYSIHIAKNLSPEEIKIPSMLLQPYVENAIWHGIMNKPEGGKIKVNVSYDQAEELTQITIIDNGVGRQKAQEYKAHNNTKSRRSFGTKLSKDAMESFNKLSSIQIDVKTEDIEKNGACAGTIVVIELAPKPVLLSAV